jgi:hypothetical protein
MVSCPYCRASVWEGGLSPAEPEQYTCMLPSTLVRHSCQHMLSTKKNYTIRKESYQPKRIALLGD